MNKHTLQQLLAHQQKGDQVVVVSSSPRGSLVDLLARLDSLRRLSLLLLVSELSDEFDTLGEKLGLKIHVMHEDVFNSMHRI